MSGSDAEPRDAAWNRVSEQFARLGENLRQRFESDAPDAPTVEGARDTLQDAFRSVGDAAEKLANTVGSVIRDPQVKDEAKQAASSLVDALGLTFSQVSDTIRRRMERSESGAGEDAWDRPDTSTPPPTVEVVERVDVVEDPQPRPDV